MKTLWSIPVIQGLSKATLLCYISPVWSMGRFMAVKKIVYSTTNTYVMNYVTLQDSDTLEKMNFVMYIKVQ